MLEKLIRRFGWISGIVFVILFIPSYLSAPDTPLSASTPEDVIAYFTARQDSILTLNGVMLAFAGFFFLFFLGALHGFLQANEVRGSGFPSAALVGGGIFVTLVLVGGAIEIMHSAAAIRFQNFQADAQIGFLSLAVSGWMYRFAFIGMAAMIGATSLEAYGTGALPKWMVLFGLIAGLAALLRFLGPLSGWLSLIWIVALSAIMLPRRPAQG